MWISVDEELPNDTGCVLIYSAGGGVAEGWYNPSLKIWIQFRWSVTGIKATHWRTLPEPPKNKSGE